MSGRVMLVAVLFMLQVTGVLWAQYMRFNQRTLDDGLSQTTVYAIVQDQQGFMWFATQDGLNKYDGREFKIFNEQFEDVTRPTFSKLGKVWVDRTDRLWIIANSGILKRFNSETSAFEIVESIQDASLLYDHDANGIYVGTYNNGLFWLPNDDPSPRQLFSDQDTALTVNDIYTAYSTVYAATANGLRAIENDALIDHGFSGLDGLALSALEGETNGGIWVGSYGDGL